MANSLRQELRDPPSPEQLADLVFQHSYDDRSQLGTDVAHSGLRDRFRKSKSVSIQLQQQPRQQEGEGRCVSFEEAPRYLRREFILSGYYIGGTHLASVRRTLFGWNNETLNAWTMFLGMVVAALAWLYGWHRSPQHQVPFAMMAASALPHAPFSIALHTMIGVSQATRDFLRTLDVFFILTCGVPRGLALALLVFTSAFCAAGVMQFRAASIAGPNLSVLSAVPRGLALAWLVFPSRGAYWLYAAAIVGDWAWSVMSTCILRKIKDIPKAQLAKDVAWMVLCYLTPMFYAAAAELLTQGAVGPETAMLAAVVALLYVAAWFYSRHLPERWHPGRYDTFGNSHQIMHLLVVAEYSLECLFLSYKAGSAV